MSDTTRRSRRVQERREAEAATGHVSMPASVTSTKAKRAYTKKVVPETYSQSGSGSGGGRTRPTKMSKRATDEGGAGKDDSASEEKPKQKQFRGNRGKLAQLTAFPLDVLFEVRSIVSGGFFSYHSLR
jgi:hypothetical protein